MNISLDLPHFENQSYVKVNQLLQLAQQLAMLEEDQRVSKPNKDKDMNDTMQMHMVDSSIDID